MKEIKTLEIDGKEYILVDSIKDEKNNYNYFTNENELTDIYVLKDKIKNDEKYFVSLDDENEFNHALELFWEKHKDDVEEAIKQ